MAGVVPMALAALLVRLLDALGAAAMPLMCAAFAGAVLAAARWIDGL